MAITAADFVLEYPEFRAVNTSQPAMVARALRLAQGQVDPIVFADMTQDAVFLLAGHHLALSPYGENLRLRDGTSVYLQQFTDLANSRRPRVMVGGGFYGQF